MSATGRSWRVATLALALMATDASGQTPDPFLTDIQALTRAPHRLSGTPEGRAAAEYIQQRLRQTGITDVQTLEMPVWQTRVQRCQLTVGGQTVDLLPLRPDILASPVTPPEGLTGRLLYAGRGEMADYGTRSAEGAIVVLEYESFDNWQRAFAMGAKAVVFIGSEKDTPFWPKHVGLPVNLVRLYAPPDVLKTIDLRQDQPEAKVVSRIPWELDRGVNVLAFLPGTNPVFDPARGPETVVLAANYDTFGIVPQDSPGARGAANVAALLDAAQYFAKNRPRRNILLMFLDNQARYHQGAREVYSALMMPNGPFEDISAEHRKQLEFSNKVAQLLSDGSRKLDGEIDVRNTAISELKAQAEFIATDLEQQLLGIRMELAGNKEAGQTQLLGEKSEFTERLSKWNDTRRALHNGTLEEIPQALFDELRERGRHKLQLQIDELRSAVVEDGQRARIRRQLAGSWIALHVAYNLSDSGPTWGPVVGDATYSGMWGADATSDNPGYYGRVLAVFRDAARQMPPEEAPSSETLSEPGDGFHYATGRFVSSGCVAGAYGIYNLSLMTGNDARTRDGHPADTLDNLQWQVIRKFAGMVEKTLGLVAGSESLSLPRTFNDVSLNALPRWSNGQSYGNFAGISTSGSISENRPAAGAMVALWAYWPAPERIWDVQSFSLPYFDAFALENVDQEGRFKLLGLRRDIFGQCVTLGARFDPDGNIGAINTGDSLHFYANAVMRLKIIPARGYTVPFTLLGAMEKMPFSEPDKAPFHVLDAVTNSDILPSRSLSGQLGNTGFFFTDTNTPIARVKVFQKLGPVLMNSSPAQPYGVGFPLSQWTTPPASEKTTAEDLWQINELRLGILRSHGANNVALELMHGRALRALERARKALSVEQQESALAESTLLSRQVYPELRDAMNDLIHGIVILLLLTIPFSFAMERLVFCATSVYTRLTGFAAVFIVTFVLLFLMHPGFALAPTPLIIFLAFTIILLSCMVIFILIRKFKDELRATQSHAHRRHRLEISQMGTILAAINMGMSTMRRRPTRTLLTCITVVLLTFTILTFASLTSSVGLRVAYEGPRSENREAGVLTRQVDYAPLPVNFLPLLRGAEVPGELLAPQWWLSRGGTYQAPFSVARADDGRAVSFEAVLGLTSQELERWPQLASTLVADNLKASQDALDKGGVFLPAAARDQLNLKAGDAILLNGRGMFFAGTLDSDALERLKHMDGRSILPADFIAAAMLKPTNGAVEQKRDVEEMSQHDVIRLNPDQICIASADEVRAQGGNLQLLTLYFPPGLDAGSYGRNLADMIPMPVWARSADGINRLIFTKVTGFEGGFALVVPIVLGGLIVFGTLLGSISDREKEIYTFSALGLAPAHIGFLFFAEAAVYAIVGGMGGELLSLAVAMAASALARAGFIQAPALNFSSSNALFADAVVMATVMISAAYPAFRASRSANPGVQRTWKLPPPDGDVLRMVFPFTVSSYDITGVISFLAEHFRAHDDAGLGKFAARDVRIDREGQEENLALFASIVLAPFDLGVAQDFTLIAVPSEIPGVDEVVIPTVRRSGAASDWVRSNRVFVQDLRRQFLLWRTLSAEMMEDYRMQTLQALGGEDVPEQKTASAQVEARA